MSKAVYYESIASGQLVYIERVRGETVFIRLIPQGIDGHMSTASFERQYRRLFGPRSRFGSSMSTGHVEARNIKTWRLNDTPSSWVARTTAFGGFIYGGGSTKALAIADLRRNVRRRAEGLDARIRPRGVR
jgi:hypothetical protein